MSIAQPYYMSIAQPYYLVSKSRAYFSGGFLKKSNRLGYSLNVEFTSKYGSILFVLRFVLIRKKVVW